MDTDKSIERTTTGTRFWEEATHPSIPSSASIYPGQSRTIVSGPRSWAPVKGSAFVYKTLRCPLEREDVAANRTAIEELFSQYGQAIEGYTQLIPIRDADKSAFGPQDHEAVRALAPGLLAHIRSSALDKAIEMWRSRQALEQKKQWSTGHAAASFGNGQGGRHCSIRMYARTYRLEPGRPIKAGNTVVRPLWADIPTPQGRVALRVGDDGYQVPILLDIISGKGGPYTVGTAIRSAELLWRGKGPEQNLFLDIRLSRPIRGEARSFESLVRYIMYYPGLKLVPVGVDIGIENTAVAVAPGKGRRGVRYFKGGALREKKRRISVHIESLKERGTRKAILDADLTRDKARRRNRAHLQEVSRDIVEMASAIADRSKGEVPVIVLEDLVFEDVTRRPARTAARDVPDGEEGIARPRTVPLRKDVANELRSWAYGQLRELIAGKAAWEGITTILVPPRGSGLECPRCRRGDVVRRRDVHRLVCPDCGYRANDDYCAAFMLATYFMDEFALMARMLGRIQGNYQYHANESVAAFDRDGRGDVEAPRSLQGEAEEASS